MSIIVLLAGCAAAPGRSASQNNSREFVAQPAGQADASPHASQGAPDSTRPTTPDPHEDRVTGSEQVIDDASRELGDDAAAQLPDVTESTPLRIDAGAARLINSILPHVDDRRTSRTNGSALISTARLRNQSHCTAREFRAFKARLAALLSAAGRSDAVQFTADADAATDYELLGTAYLVTDNGFDQWELFLTLTPSGEDWSLWRTPHPVRVLRFPRDGQQQIYPGP